jgi:hypothetical protein
LKEKEWEVIANIEKVRKNMIDIAKSFATLSASSYSETAVL